MSEQTHAIEKVNTSMWNVEDTERYAENMRVIDEWNLGRADERKSQERFQERLKDFWIHARQVGFGKSRQR